jgi:Fic family protein
MYIYEQKGWPEFSWDHERVNKQLIYVRYIQGILIGAMSGLGFQERDACTLRTLTEDVVKSSEIEGEILDPASVRSSVARRLGMEEAALGKADQQVEGVVDMMLDATQHYEQPLTAERIFGWHISLFPRGRNGFSRIEVGKWRKGPVQVISGGMGREKIHFEGPPPSHVGREMKQFLLWMNEAQEMDGVLKAAIAHLWFVTVHPFDDGNGRIARAIADLLLARSENSVRRFYSLSAQILKERKEYYFHLEKTQKGGLEITLWLHWFLGCLGRAIEGALAGLHTVFSKGKFWKAHASLTFNERQKKLLNLLLDGIQGKLTSSKWAKIGKCSQDTAYRDIKDLLEKGILVKDASGGRSTSYSLFHDCKS